jgi:acyl-coenzyme A synthetase/AMP-(fatty) acid ligase/thioesterase domain-containing protein/acyl carrier protein
VNCAAPFRWLGTPPRPLDWNGPEAREFVPFAPSDLDQPVISLFENTARRFPDNIAAEDTRTRLTYRELHAAVCALAARIMAETSPGELVGILLPTCVEFPVAMLACLAAGRPFVPLDLHYPRAWIVDVMEDACMSAVIGYFGVEEVAGLVPPGVKKIELAVPETDSAFEPIPLGVDAPEIVIYTSGSTGRPKGIVNSQRNLLRRVEQYVNAAHINSHDRFMPFSSACTIAGLRERFSALLTGASLHLFDVQRASVREIVRTLHDKKVTIVYAVPALLRSLMQLGEEPAPPSLRVVRVGGDAVLWSDVESLRRWLPETCLIELGYSSTEAPIMQWFVPRDFPQDGARVPIGHALEGNTLAILDEAGRPADTGELVVRSPYVALGRWIDGHCVADGFEPDPENPFWRILHTGDLVRLREDGLIDLIGRKDRQVKIRGFRVEPGEIEAALRRRASVLDAAILPRRIGDTTILAAYVVGRDEECSETALRAFMKEALPPHLQPQRLYLCDEIPRLPSAKLDMKALLARDAEKQAREEAACTSEPKIDAPRASLVEETVSAIWRALLKRPQIDRDADFFDLGGDSLLTLELMLRLEEALGVELPVTMIYDYPTVAWLSQAIESEAAPEFSPLVAIKSAGEGAPLFIVHGVGGNVMELFGFGRRLDCPVYGLQAKGLDGRAEPNRGIADMAEYYLAAIRGKQPHGPYRLSGYSSGGLIALEMAQRLRAQGEEIALLALLDTQTHASQWPLSLWLAKLWQRTGHHLRTLAHLSRNDVLRYALKAAGGLYRRFARRTGHVANASHGIPPALAEVYNATIAAVAAYRPAFYDGPITLLKSELGDPLMADPARIWKSRARILHIYNVPGGHRTMIRGANGDALAKILNRCLARA